MNNNFNSMSSEIGTANNYARWIVDMLQPHFGRKVLEVGIGYDNYRPLLPPLEAHWSVDVDKSAIDNAQSENPNDNYLLGNITDPVVIDRLRQEGMDTVLCLNVLEHIEEDGVALRGMLEVLKPGGHLLLFVPAFPVLYSDLDRLAGHYRRYTFESMKKVLEPISTGEIVELAYFNPIGGLGWWMNTFMSHTSLNDANVNRQVKIFDRYIVPFSRMLNGVTKRVFGQSLICVVRRH